MSKWYGRFLEFGPDGLEDRSSRPHESPAATRDGLVDLVVALRRAKKWGPARIAASLELDGIEIASATVHRILVRQGISRLRDMDPPSGEQLRVAQRYEHDQPGGQEDAQAPYEKVLSHPMLRRADSCIVSANAQLDEGGRMTVAIRAARR